MKYISRLQYITQKETFDDIEKEVRQFLTGGGDWVQLRMKGATFEEFMRVAFRVKELCYAFNATFIINDNVEVALRCGADGVHLGKTDIPTSEARRIMGNKIIIGRTANTVRDIEILSGQRNDYIGLGPYKYTETKKDIADILGLDGYKRILGELYADGVPFPPIVAIGSVDKEDIPLLMSIEGMHGIAVSGAIAKSKDPMRETMNFVEKIDLYNI